MKTIERDLFPYQESILFSSIRDKCDYVRILVHSARYLLLEYSSHRTPISSIMKLVVDKMSRLFFYKGDKYFSISFPLSVEIESNNVTEIKTYSGKLLDNKSISAIISIIDSHEFKSKPSLLDFFGDSNDIELSDVFLLEEIFQFEPSYIRYDFDPKNENGNFHPLHHLDINYSQYGKYKLGLSDQISKDDFENLHNTTTECSYLTPARRFRS